MDGAAPPSSSAAGGGGAVAAADARSTLVTPTKTALLLAAASYVEPTTHPGVEKATGGHGASSSSSSTTTTTMMTTTGQRIAGSEKTNKTTATRWPPVSSSKSLPPLAGRVRDLWNASTATGATGGERRRGNKVGSDVIEFEVNQECTSIGLVPSGRLAVAGFTDGTLRLFDLTGIFAKDKNHPALHDAASASNAASRHARKEKDCAFSSSSSSTSAALDELFDDDASSNDDDEIDDDDDDDENSLQSSKSRRRVVDSRSNQRYGAVSCQIHARGVHTSLLMDVAVSEDGLYAFGGVQRGSVELAAVYLGDVEGYLDERLSSNSTGAAGGSGEDGIGRGGETPGLLDLIQVDRHADAKLKGFGACTRLWNGWERARNGVERPEYLLLTGKGIKNIHIWSYRPSRLSKNEDSVWTCLYDTQTNGTSINQLYFRHNLHGTLQAISKSDDQKLRVWDLMYEQTRIANGTDGSDRPKRPDYVDVASTEGTVGVCGPYAFASGSLGGMHNIINVVGLDADDVSSPFNCSELLLPVDCVGSECTMSGNRTSRTGRQQRGDLKSVEHVAGLVFDASHALLQLSDGSVVHYLHDLSGHPLLLQIPPSLCTTSIDDDTSFGVSPATGLSQNKKMSLARVGSQAMVLFAVSSFNENTSRGAIMLRALPGSGANDGIVSKSFRRYWGFNGLKKKRKQQASIGSSEVVSMAPSSLNSPVVTSVGLVSVESTPATVANPVDQAKKSYPQISKRPSEDRVKSTPAPFSRGDSKARKVSPDAGDLTPAPLVSKVDMLSATSKSQHDDDGMDSQLEVIVQGAALSPKILKNDREKFIPAKKHKMAQSRPNDDTPKKKQKTAVQDKKQAVEVEVNPKPSANDFVSMPPAADESNTIRAVGFLGVTIFDRRDDVQLPESCYQPKQRPALLVEQLPNSALSNRPGNVPAIQSSLSTKVTTATEGVHFKRHCDERQHLAAKHRAEHEMIRKKVLHSIRYVLATWDVELSTNKPRAAIVESAKKWFDDALACHQEMLDDMLGRQIMEAESLAARQTSELVDKRASVLQVSFPFPQVFEQARQEMISMIQ